MTLIESYLNEIVRQLPKKQRADVRAELRAALADALESKVDGEASEADVVALLREFGHPEAVASSYRPQNQYLVGPELFPAFRSVAAVVITVLVGLVTFGFLVDLLVDGPAEGRAWLWVLRYLGGVWDTALSAFAIIVLIFALLQRFDAGTAAEEPWDPRELPAARDRDLVGRGEAVVGIVIPVVFLGLLNIFKDHFGVRVEPGAVMLLNDVFQASLPWLNLALLLGVALNTWLLRTGRWNWPTRLFNFGIDVYWIVLLFSIAAGVVARKATLIGAGVPEPVAGIIVTIVAFVPWLVMLAVLWGVASFLYRSHAGDGGSAGDTAIRKAG